MWLQLLLFACIPAHGADPPEIPDKGARKYWWRGQGAAYLMRLNPSTLAALRDLRGREEVLEAVVLAV